MDKKLSNKSKEKLLSEFKSLLEEQWYLRDDLDILSIVDPINIKESYINKRLIEVESTLDNIRKELIKRGIFKGGLLVPNFEVKENE